MSIHKKHESNLALAGVTATQIPPFALESTASIAIGLIMLSWEKLLSPTTEVTCWNSCCASSANFIDPSAASPCTKSLLPSSVPRQRWPLTSSRSSQTMEPSILVTKSLGNGPWDEMKHSGKHAPSILDVDSCVATNSTRNGVKQPQNSTKSTFQQGSDEKSVVSEGNIIAHSFSIKSLGIASGAVGGPVSAARTSRKRECQDETAATESSMQIDIFSETTGSHAGTSTSQTSVLQEEQEPEIDIPAVVALPFSEDSILSSYTNNISEIDVGDAPSIRSFRIPISRGKVARGPKTVSEHEKQSIGEHGRRNDVADYVGTISTKTVDDDLRSKEIARGFVPDGADSFLAVQHGGRKAFHNFVFRRCRRSLMPELELSTRIATPTTANFIGSASPLHTASPNAPTCGCTMGTEGPADDCTQHVTSLICRRVSAKRPPLPLGADSCLFSGCGNIRGGQRVDAKRPLKCQRCGSTKIRLFKTAIPSSALHNSAAHRHTKSGLRKLLSVQRDVKKGEIPHRLKPLTPKEGLDQSEWDARSPWSSSTNGEAKCGIAPNDDRPNTPQVLSDAESISGWKKGWRYQEPSGSW